MQVWSCAYVRAGGEVGCMDRGIVCVQGSGSSQVMGSEVMVGVYPTQ